MQLLPLICPRSLRRRRQPLGARSSFHGQQRNPNARKAYARAVGKFASGYGLNGLHELGAIEPTHVEPRQRWLSPPWVKLSQAALRMLFDRLVVGQVMPMNPASLVRKPRRSLRKGKTPVVAAEEARALLDAIDVSTLPGPRDRARAGPLA